MEIPLWNGCYLSHTLPPMDGIFLALVIVGSDIRFQPPLIVDSRQHDPAGPRFWVDGLLRLEERQQHTVIV